MGGQTTTEARLDAMFIPGLQDGGVGAGNGAGTAIFNPGNEPSFGTPFLYNYLGKRQWKSVMRSREVVDQYYSNGRDGIPGNSDAGALESWMVWNLLGKFLDSFIIYPVFFPGVWGGNADKGNRYLPYCHTASLPPPLSMVRRSVDIR